KIKELDIAIPESFHKILTFLSQEITEGKRIQETLLLMEAIDGPVHKREFQLKMIREGYHMDDLTMESIIRVLNHEFYKTSDQKKFAHPLIEIDGEVITITKKLQEALGKGIIKEQIENLMELSILNSNTYNQSEQLTINRKYGRKDVCRLLNWEKDEAST